MAESQLKELLQKVLENQEELQNHTYSTGSPEESLELPHDPEWLLDDLKEVS